MGFFDGIQAMVAHAIGRLTSPSTQPEAPEAPEASETQNAPTIPVTPTGGGRKIKTKRTNRRKVSRRKNKSRKTR